MNDQGNKNVEMFSGRKWVVLMVIKEDIEQMGMDDVLTRSVRQRFPHAITKRAKNLSIQIGRFFLKWLTSPTQSHPIFPTHLLLPIIHPIFYFLTATISHPSIIIQFLMLLDRKDSLNLSTYRPSPLILKGTLRAVINLTTSKTPIIQRRNSSHSLSKNHRVFGIRLPDISPGLKKLSSLKEKVFDGIKMEEIVIGDEFEEDIVKVGFASKLGCCVVCREFGLDGLGRKRIQLYRRVGMNQHVVELLGSQLVKQDQTGNTVAMVVEKVEAGSLQQILQCTIKLPAAAIRNIAEQVLTGLIHIHSKDVIHMDLTTKNIMIDSRGTYKIGGWFRKAELLGAKITGISRLQQLSPYTPPELIFNSELEASPSIDIWQFGCLLLDLVDPKILKLPPKITLPQRKQYLSELFFYAKYLEEYPMSFLLVVQKCLQRNPKNRPKAAELLKMPFFTGKSQ